MPSSRILTIGLDGFELSLADKMICEGLLPNFRRLRERSTRWLLDHGLAKYSGLAWEHVSSGISPQDSGRWSAVDFDPRTYGIEQKPTRSRPFFAQLSAKTVLFDVPYCDIAKAPDVWGLVNWGAHDPGVEERSRPGRLRSEILGRFGPYPAPEYIYGFLWPSPEKTQVAADGLVKAVEVRSDIAHWLLTERFPDWQLGFVVVSECHSAIEPMWHGIDEGHPLHDIASAPAASDGLRRVYTAIDRLIGKLLDSFPDATALVFSMHGMGPNRGDIPSMCLLPELLCRHAFGKAYMREVSWSNRTRNGSPLLSGTHHWYDEMTRAVPPLGPGQLHDKSDDNVDGEPFSVEASNLDWMPVSRYRCFWPKMHAFALPAFYDGRVRINLAGRESRGAVPLERYRSLCHEIIELVRKCRDVTNGAEIVEDVCFEDKNPFALNATEADIYIYWRGTSAGISHPTLGQIGPIPYYRTGGHTGESGFLYASKKGISSRDAGLASSFDVVPTIVDLLGEADVRGLSGKSIKPLFAQRSFVSTALRQVAHRMGLSQ